jgi:hypothetical protein
MRSWARKKVVILYRDQGPTNKTLIAAKTSTLDKMPPTFLLVLMRKSL